MNPEIELIKINPEDSTANKIGQQAVIWKNNGNLKATLWNDIKCDWSLDNSIFVMGAQGFTARYLALFVGVDKYDMHCYAIYDPDF